jgi:hypothetical protein
MVPCLLETIRSWPCHPGLQLSQVAWPQYIATNPLYRHSWRPLSRWKADSCGFHSGFVVTAVSVALIALHTSEVHRAVATDAVIVRCIVVPALPWTRLRIHYPWS